MHEQDRRMWSLATSSSIAAAAAVSSDSFSKDGRRISIGDCALFKPPQDSPPFIGVIRRLISGKEENLKLSVNWLYRSADVELGKGASVEAAPNEIFYSFHKDEIPAASILHPCKVAFLCKGAELPSGISSFVSRRVYDVENKCLWWLTDQDYINERQEEVDLLLQKTQLDMYGAVQSGGRSPKVLNGTSGSQQLRSGSENAQNISSHLPSQIKIKKRDRVDQSSDPIKKERLSRADDAELGQLRADHILRFEIAKITDRGGLVDYEGVQKLVKLMQPGSAEKKIDLACRMMLVNVIAVTDKFDCLGQFIQLRGLPVLDEWLQEVHKGKIGDSSSPKEIDKSVDEFLLILLRALDKLPVNLHALQTSNVGKSVNHLRTHKNIEIQKKARSLVDTWKKRVEAEMNVLDSKPGSSRGSSWPTKSMPCAKFGSGESVAKMVALSPHPSKPVASSSNNSILVTVPGSNPLSTIKEEESSSCVHAQNNNQTCSSDHAKTIGSTFGSISGTKISVSSPRHQKSSYSFQGSALLGVPKETSLNNNVGLEKVSPPGYTHGNVCDVTVSDHGNSQRLIVRLPNTGRSPARNSTGGPYEDPATLSKSSPVNNYHQDRKVKGKSDPDTALKGDAEEGNLSPPVASYSDKKQLADNIEKVIEAPTGSVLTSGYKPREGNLYDDAFKSMNALVESCLKFSEASTTVSSGDNIGMNLLATVAAAEMSRSDGSASVSRGKNLPVPEESFSGNDVNSRHIDDDTARSEDPACNGGSTLVQDNPIDSCVKYEPLDDSLRTLANVSADDKASADAAIGLSSVNTITKEIIRNGDVDKFHDQRISGKYEAMDADHKNEKNVENNSSKIPKVVGNTKPDMKEAKGESQYFSSTGMCSEEKSEVLCRASGSEILNEQKLHEIANTVQDIVNGRCKASALPLNSVSVKSLETGVELTADTKAASQVEPKQSDNVRLTVSDQSQTKDIVEKSDKNFVVHCPGKSLPEEPTTVRLQKTLDSVKLNENEAAKPEVVVKLDFDLNEGFDVDDGSEEEIAKSPLQGNLSSSQLRCPLPLPLSSMSSSFPASVTVASAAKGPFYPPENSFIGKGELGWKGSAATSAFRPAEPRKILDRKTGSPPVDNMESKQERPYLDFDLNVVDEEVLENESHGGLDLDLNRVDESHEVRKPSVDHRCNIGVAQVFGRPSLSEGFPNAKSNTSRDFDLNNGPGLDDVASDTASLAKSYMPFISPLPGVRISGSDQQWFSPGNSYQPIAMTPVLPHREQGYPIPSGSQRIMAHPAGITSFGPEFYRGQVLSSSPALPFPNNVPFQYPFPFETNFSAPSHSYPNTSTSHLIAPSGVMSSHYPRAYMMNIPGSASNAGPDSRRWVGQGLDLNSGPRSAEVERKDERLSSAFRQNLAHGSQAFSADEQLRMFQMAGGSLKRKDPDGGLDGNRMSYKQPPPPWQ